MTESEARELISKLTFDEKLTLYAFMKGLEEQRALNNVQEAAKKE